MRIRDRWTKSGLKASWMRGLDSTRIEDGPKNSLKNYCLTAAFDIGIHCGLFNLINKVQTGEKSASHKTWGVYCETCRTVDRLVDMSHGSALPTLQNEIAGLVSNLIRTSDCLFCRNFLHSDPHFAEFFCKWLYFIKKLLWYVICLKIIQDVKPQLKLGN